MSLNVLVVDDSEIIRRMILKTLDLSQIPLGRTLQAGNGREALELMREEWVDMVIADLNMPIMDGMELLHAMRESDELRSLPVIVVSTEGASTRLAALKDMGVTTFVRKPFTPEQIRDAITAFEQIAETAEHEVLVADLAGTVLERFAMMFAEPMGEPADVPNDELIVSMLRFSGVVTGIVTAAAPQHLCSEIARTALGIDGEVSAHESADALGEFTNMLAGMLGTTIDADLHTELTPPEVSRMTPEAWALLAAQPHVVTLSVEGAPMLVALRMRREQ